MTDTIVLTKEFIEGIGLNNKQDSISVTKNSKGFNFDFKVYFKDMENNADVCVAKMVDIKNKLNREFGDLV